MRVNIAVDTRQFETTLEGWEKSQLPFAMAKTLTNVAKMAQGAIRGAMQEVFDRPTPFTLNATVVVPATKTRLYADVMIKDRNVKGAPPTVWLQPQVDGGTRQAKRSEILLRNAGVMRGGLNFFVPGSEAKLDSYGNMSRAQMQQILSAVKAFNAAGFSANRTATSFDKSKTKLELFVGRPAGGRLPLGVYKRVYQGKGKEEKLLPLLLFVSQPHYHKLLPFQAVIESVYNANFEAEFDRNLRDALVLSAFTEAA